VGKRIYRKRRVGLGPENAMGAGSGKRTKKDGHFQNTKGLKVKIGRNKN